MEAVWAAAITGFFGLLTALVAVFKEELRAYIRSKGRPIIIVEEAAPIPIDSITLADDSREEIRKKPFDTKTELLRSPKGDAYLFRIHQLNKGWYELVFMVGWIIAWTAGIVFAALVFFSMLFSLNDPFDSTSMGMHIFTIVFMGGWLVGALAGEFQVARAIKNRLARVLGQLQITVTRNGITVAKVFGGLISKKHYDAEKIDGFGETGSTVLSHGVTIKSKYSLYKHFDSKTLLIKREFIRS